MKASDYEIETGRRDQSGPHEISLIRRFLCWLRGHAWDKGHAHGWSGYVTYRCQRCRRTTWTQFDF